MTCCAEQYVCAKCGRHVAGLTKNEWQRLTNRTIYADTTTDDEVQRLVDDGAFPPPIGDPRRRSHRRWYRPAVEAWAHNRNVKFAPTPPGAALVPGQASLARGESTFAGGDAA